MIDPRTLSARLLAGSRFAMPRAEALAEGKQRRAALQAPPAPPEQDHLAAPENPADIVDAPESFARAFWRERGKKTPPTPKPKKPPKLRVIPGGADGGDNSGV